ncbi:MAG: hypothetical protein AMJ76_01640 [Dehalococcoidia bacterium SM23_28_1]|nr:MAG: hypothetical protein AMJ76_01640 [Dehalococcoidia bacterium SM23_28_1]
MPIRSRIVLRAFREGYDSQWLRRWRSGPCHLGNIFNKLAVGSRTETILHALRRGWFSLQDEFEGPSA